MSSIQVYRMTEYECVAAESLEEARQFYTKETGEQPDDEHEVDNLDINFVIDNNDDVVGPPAKLTYREQIEHMLTYGAMPPFWFCFAEP